MKRVPIRDKAELGDRFPIPIHGFAIFRSQERGEAGSGPRAEKAKRRILIVEDEALIAWNLQTVVESMGYTVCGTAATGARAIKLAEQEKPDLILMDVRLADNISGIQAAEQILADRQVPIIFITAFTDPRMAERIASLGAHCLSKPVMPEVLGQVIARIFDSQRRH